jgi:hypothetical protein
MKIAFAKKGGLWVKIKLFIGKERLKRQKIAK